MLIKEDTESCWKVGLDRRGVTFLIINFNGKFLSLRMKKEKRRRKLRKKEWIYRETDYRCCLSFQGNKLLSCAESTWILTEFYQCKF